MNIFHIYRSNAVRDEHAKNITFRDKLIDPKYQEITTETLYLMPVSSATPAEKKYVYPYNNHIVRRMSIYHSKKYALPADDFPEQPVFTQREINEQNIALRLIMILEYYAVNADNGTVLNPETTPIKIKFDPDIREMLHNQYVKTTDDGAMNADHFYEWLNMWVYTYIWDVTRPHYLAKMESNCYIEWYDIEDKYKKTHGIH
jgi:hypothetical protein